MIWRVGTRDAVTRRAALGFGGGAGFGKPNREELRTVPAVQLSSGGLAHDWIGF